MTPGLDADYYVCVTTPDGGLNFRSEPNLKSDNYALIPDFEILHIISVVDDSWGEDDV